MASNKIGRINDDIQRVLAAKLRDVKDPRVAGKMITVTSADVSGDLKFAKIYYSVLEEHDPREVKAGLKGATGYIRKRLAETLNMRITPELTFIEDSGVKHGADIAAILRVIGSAKSEEGEKQ